MLQRNPVTFQQQDRFGKASNPAGQRGNCFQACLATILALPLTEVPHFFDTDEECDQQRANANRWLAERGWVCLWIPWEWVQSDWVCLPEHALVIVSGKSPRGDWNHVVIGRIVKGDWSLVHDPYPAGTGLDGTPNGFYLLAPLPTLAITSSPVRRGHCRLT